MWPQSSEQELKAERVHYEIIRNLVANNAFNAVRYLYDRLNILDAKAQGLLPTTVSMDACGCNEPRPDSRQRPALCRYRNLLNDIKDPIVLEQSVRLSRHRPDRDIAAYETTFFDIAIRRRG
jgi:hypothetical protein